MTKMSKTAALNAARNAVSDVIRTGSCSYVVYGPYEDIDGPRTFVSYDSFPRAQDRRATWVASVALSLMGVEYDVLDLDECAGRAQRRVETVLRKAK